MALERGAGIDEQCRRRLKNQNPSDTPTPFYDTWATPKCSVTSWVSRSRGVAFATRWILTCSVTVYARYGDFSGVEREHRFREQPLTGRLFQIAASARPNLSREQPVRLLGIGASQLVWNEPTSLFRKEQKMTRAIRALDSIQRRWGDHAWTRASLLRTSLLTRTSGFAYDHEA